ncbi:hypothetical protein Ade02nite_20950 [Paractinoplanes deccanensis]|uniref:Uncharacterized protein n=1 Tax=Paractinoplanes deccanensis TaxID=113561 RepID=A0ABQ3Y0E0_9ACTN|nr:hypothetical protein [Actinoplanes deccanensis]GID73454.1 hypothetical protein Ade02nite_20950 [Actinoplanes deccanensis]
MRTKIRTSQTLKPGMVVRATGQDSFGLDLTTYRQVEKVYAVRAYSSAVVHFTDGTRANVGYSREFQVARNKAQRNAAIRRAATPQPTRAGIFDVMTRLLGAYAAA